MAVRHALYLPPFGELANPQVMVDIAVAAEDVGWDAIFLWDHILRPGDSPMAIADTWILLAAIASATSQIRLGPMVTPLGRRRPQKVARESVTLDHLSQGRLTLGLGLGVDGGGELTSFGEVTDEKARGDRLDEGVDLLEQLWSGAVVRHEGPSFVADGVQFRPGPIQQPRIPLWFAARGGTKRPVRRAAHFDGLFPVETDLGQLEQMLEIVASERGNLDAFDVAVLAIPGVDLDAAEALGATWAMWSFLEDEPAADVLACVEAGPGGFG